LKKFPLLFLLYKLHNPPTPANINKGGRREAERERRGEREKGGGEKRRKGARKEERGRREKEREKEEQVSQYSDLNKITKPKNRASGGYSHPSPPLPVLQPPLS